jgi:alginate O-acetyltransferase complex protein AlgI
MVFSSPVFLFYFLPAALSIYFALGWAPQRLRNLWLAIAGYFFYGWADPRFVPLMLGTTLLDWVAGLVIAHNTWRLWRVWPWMAVAPVRPDARTARQKTAVVLSIVSNLLVLGVFKYFNFGLDSYNAAMASLGFEGAAWEPALRVILPLGISFYTFQSMGYVIDVYRGQAAALPNFIDFSCFVSMFPHLVAGPILQFSFLARQLESRPLSLDRFARGVALFSLGLGKKVLIANPCGHVADALFGAGGAHALDAWYGLTAYAFQIYFDFSGYSDMAIGLGLMLGFIFAKNFDSPYRSASITEFWRRWHISLSSWLRDYLYIPLGGSTGGSSRTVRNVLLTMLLGGLWHGASWNFVLWGGVHGGWLAMERRLGPGTRLSSLPRAVKIAGTFGVVILAWVFFRAPTLPAAMRYFASLAGAGRPTGEQLLASAGIYEPYYLLAMGAGAGLTWLAPQAWDMTRDLTWTRAVWCTCVLWLAVVCLFTQAYNPFIYFIF